VVENPTTQKHNKSPGANRRWRFLFRYRGSRRESAVAQLLFTLGHVAHRTKIMKTLYRVIFVGLLTCSFLSGCSRHESSTTPKESNVSSQTVTVSNVISVPFTVTVSSATNRKHTFTVSNASSEPLTVSNKSVTITVTN